MEPLLLQLDIRTLAFVCGLGGFLMTAAMVGIRVAGTRHPALFDWALAGACFGIGFQLGLMLVPPWPTWLLAALANALIGAGHCLVLAGVRRYLERPSWARPLLLLIALVLLATLLFDGLRGDLRLRVLLNLALYGLIDVAAAVLLWRARAVDLTAWRRLVAVVLGVNSAAIFGRFLYVMAQPQLPTAVVRDPLLISLLLVNMVFLFVLITALAVMLFRAKAVQLHWLVLHDPMTGLLNRRSLLERAEREVARSARYGSPLSLLMLDIDAFKAINDRHGHAQGDEVLRQVAATLQANLRDTDVAFRLGGEEFLVILPATAAVVAAELAERLRLAIAATPIRGGSTVTASIGVTEVLARREKWEDAVDRADAALYRAKHEGRDRAVLLPHPQAATAAAEVVADDLRAAGPTPMRHARDMAHEG